MFSREESYPYPSYFQQSSIFSERNSSIKKSYPQQSCDFSNSYHFSSISNEHNSSIPEDYCCPITHEIMLDPVMIADGHSYERNAIAKWLLNNNTSPLTAEELEHKHVTPNYTLRKAIQTYIQENKHRYQEQFIKAVEQGNYDSILQLERLGIDINTSDRQGWTPLHHMARLGKVEYISALIAKGFDKNAATASIDVSEQIGRLQKAKKHLNSNLEKEKNNLNELIESKNKCEASVTNSASDIECITSQITSQIESLKNYRSNNYEYLSNLKKELKDAEEKLRESTAMLEYFNKSSKELNTTKKIKQIELQLEDVEKIMIIAIKISRSSPRPHHLLGLSPFHVAIYYGQEAAATCLMNAQVNLELSPQLGFDRYSKENSKHELPPIHLTIYRNKMSLVQLLIKSGIDFLKVNEDGSNLLHLAAQHADQEIIAYLFSLGFNNLQKNSQGETAEVIATKFKRTEISKFIKLQHDLQWQGLPQRLNDTNQRINNLEKIVASLQKQVTALTANNQNVSQATQQSLANSSASMGLFSSPRLTANAANDVRQPSDVISKTGQK